MPEILTISSEESCEVGSNWDDLVRRAEPNVFMHPAAVEAARRTGFARTRTLLAWKGAEGSRRLVGLWTLQHKSAIPLGPTLLSALPYDYAFLSNPVVDPEFAEDVIPAFLEAIERDSNLEKVLHCRYLDSDNPAFAVLERTLARRGAAVRTLALGERPFVTPTSGVKSSGATRKKLRQDWNRLCAAGVVEIVNDRAPEAVLRAFETFLAMEAASWKGEQGTALLSHAADARFARALVAGLCAQGAASVAELRLDGRAVALQVLLYSGKRAYTWKTAYDARYSKFSPGALLVDKITETLFASGDVDSIESCSPEGGFMEQIWSGRRHTVELVADLGPKRSIGYLGFLALQKGRAELKSLRHDARLLAFLPFMS
jgi:CelD/BcsL family acetyltransferase involved in cellulose biosynthesis